MRNQLGKPRNWNTSSSRTVSEGMDLLDTNAEACEAVLQQHIARLRSGRSGGWWRAAVYVVAESEAALQSVAGALRSIGTGDASALDPLRVVPLLTYLARDAVQRGQILSLESAGGAAGHPLGDSYSALATCLTSDELAVLVNLPQQEIPGLPMRDTAAFALSAPPPTADAIVLGDLQDGMGRDLGPLSVTAEALNYHTFVTGVTGCGKTNTCMQNPAGSLDQAGRALPGRGACQAGISPPDAGAGVAGASTPPTTRILARTLRWTSAPRSCPARRICPSR